MYQQGSLAIGSNVSEVAVLFSPDFDSIPALIIPVVANTSSDSTKYLLTATVVGRTTSGFTARLSAATNTANYKLNWVAGDPQVLFQLVSVLGVPVSALPEHGSELQDDDAFVVNAAGQLPVTKRLLWSRIKEYFVRRVTAPTGPTSPGSTGELAWDANYLYTKHGGLWGRTPRSTTWS